MSTELPPEVQAVLDAALLSHRDAARWLCTCPDARHDDWECPTCRRPSFSAERIQALRGAA